MAFRRLETLVLRQIEKDPGLRADPAFTFDSVVGAVNGLLDNVEMRREGVTFRLYTKGTNDLLTSQNLNSGESELISLAIECLVFEKECVPGKINILFLDEPDVHLHPDLQARFGRFLKEQLKNSRVVIATHSTAFLGAFTDYGDVSVAFMRKGDKTFTFEAITEVYRRVLPVFGAHPLSNLFNEAPILLVEGEDDERIWQHAVRTSRGRIKVYPCAVDSVQDLKHYEKEVQKILSAVYDKPRAYSCRDGDGIVDPITDLPPVIRFRLNCRAAENLILTDDVLGSFGMTWDALKQKMEDWLNKNPGHSHFSAMEEFKNTGFLRKDFDIKEIRNDIMGIVGSSKSWEIAVGKAIASIRIAENPSEDSLQTYLGEKLIGALFPTPTI